MTNHTPESRPKGISPTRGKVSIESGACTPMCP
jgi:hypothetical protein